MESDRCPSFQAAREAGKPVTVPILSTLADGLAVPTVGYNAFVTANSLIDKMVKNLLYFYEFVWDYKLNFNCRLW